MDLKKRGHVVFRHLLATTLLAFLVNSAPLWAQKNIESQYSIGPGDKLSVSFWQDPELNFTTTVTQDSMIVLSVGGSIKAGGLTVEQLSNEIVEHISIFNRRITSTTVKVVEYGSNKIYVMGKVRTPGKYTFESIPGLWQVLLEAGGPTPDANLNNVLIVRDQQSNENTIQIDVATALRQDHLNSLPSLHAGDNIYVPARVGQGNSGGIDALQGQENVLFIYGQVGSPGVHTFQKSLNLLEALVTAGGPTPQAKLENVRVIRKIGNYSTVTRVDVERYSKGTVPDIFMVQGGDSIYVPRKGSFRESFVWDLFMIAAGAAVTATVYATLAN